VKGFVMPVFRQQQIVANLKRRAKVLAAVRRFFAKEGFLEVETPNRIPAPAPEAHIEAEPSGSWYLHTSPELCMKRLLAAGYGRIWQLCKCYRRSERGRRHLPEMTLLEWYAAGWDYNAMMASTRDLVRAVMDDACGGSLVCRGRRIDLEGPWQELTVAEAFRLHAEVSPEQALADGRFDEVMGLVIEPRLGWERPVFLKDYPAELACLARLKKDDPAVAERFELYIAGLELCNGFSELTDAAEQRERFAAEQEARKAAGKAVYPPAEPFLRALEDMPPAAGNALGIDRLVMLACDADAIDQVVAFVPEEL